MIKIVISVLALLLLTAPAAAIDFALLLIDPEGCPLRDEFAHPRTDVPRPPDGCAPSDRPGLTLGRAVYRALLFSYRDEGEVAGDEKLRRGALAERVWSAKGELALAPEDLVLIKKLIGKLYAPAVVARAWPLLDPTLAK